MAQTCQEQILALLQEQLEGLAAGVPGLKVERDRVGKLETDELPRLLLFIEGEDPQDDLAGEQAIVLRVSIQGAVTGADDAAARAAADALRGLLDNAMTAAGLPPAIKANDVRLSPEPAAQRFDLPEEEPAYGLIRVYDIDFSHVEGDAFTFA